MGFILTFDRKRCPRYCAKYLPQVSCFFDVCFCCAIKNQLCYFKYNCDLPMFKSDMFDHFTKYFVSIYINFGPTCIHQHLGKYAIVGIRFLNGSNTFVSSF